MAFLGKEYVFQKQENYEDFINTLGLSPEHTQLYLNYSPSIKVTQNGDSYTITSTTTQTKNEVIFKSGVTFDEKLADRPSKTTYTVDGTTVTQVQQYEDGNNLTIVRQFSGDELVVTLTTSKSDIVARRYYKA